MMNAMSDRRILIVEDDDDWGELIAEAIQEVLRDIGREADYVVMHAKDEQQALDLMNRHAFALVSMDINLSDVTEGTSEGLGLLERLEASTSDTWSIIVSGEDKSKYMQDAFEKYNILRFFEKAHWVSGECQELKTAVKSILLYTDALIHLGVGDWEQANDSWQRACEFAPELRKRFKYVGVLVEKARSEATDQITGLPIGEIVESKLRDLLRAKGPWGILYVTVDNLEEYYRKYGHVEGDSALKTVARFLQDRAGQASFIGYPERGLFMVVVEDHLRAQSLNKRLLGSFRDIYSNLYPFQDLDQIGVVKAGIPELTLAIRLVSDQDGPFADIREISRRGSGSGSVD
jgi:PleD family two-component response regulator